MSIAVTERVMLTMRKAPSLTPAEAMVNVRKSLMPGSQSMGRGEKIVTRVYPIMAIAGMAGPSLLQGVAAAWVLAKFTGQAYERRSISQLAAAVKEEPDKGAAVRELMNQRIITKSDFCGSKQAQAKAWDALIAAGHIVALDADHAAVKFNGTFGEFTLPVALSEKPKEDNALVLQLFKALQATKALEPLQQDRLATQLGKGIQVLDIPSAVRIYKDVYAKPHFWSVGAGRRFFNKAWLGVIWTISALPVVLDMAPVAGRIKGGLVLTLGLWGLGKLVGFVREQLYLRRLRRLVNETPDGREQFRTAISQLPPPLQKRLAVKV